MAAGTLLSALVGAALILYLLYLFYGFLHRAFQRVGFTQGETGLIIFGSIVGGFINLPFAQVNGWLVAINVGGAVVPLVVSYLLLKRFPGIGLEATVGITLVAITTYFVTTATPAGIVSPFPLWLAPPLVAALISLVAFWREETFSAPLAYVSGSLGALVGADVFRLGEFLSQTPPAEGAVAAIGGASVFDMVFLAGIIAVGLDMLLFRERRRMGISDEDAAVFRTTTSAEAIRDFDAAAYFAARDHAEQRARKQAPGAVTRRDGRRPPL